MNTKTLATIATFTALTMVLNLSPIKFPAPYMPFLKYQIWEIPIVAAFLLFGSVIGITIAIMNTAVLLVVYPGDLPTGPFYNLVAIISMLLGMMVIKIFIKRNPTQHKEPTLITAYTVLGIVFRVFTMTVVNWVFLRFPPPVGYSIPEESIHLYMPFIALFNATLALYTIPLGYVVAKATKTAVKTLA